MVNGFRSMVAQLRFQEMIKGMFLLAVICCPEMLYVHAAEAQGWDDFTRMRFIVPRGYVCYRATKPVVIDGKLDEEAWTYIPWTEYFGDIEGDAKPRPRFRTQAKMLWDDTYFYVGAFIEDTHVWATLTKHDAVIFYDNDFEIFIDPDSDNHEYYEIEINALNTEWDLFLKRPYKDFSPGMGADNGWEIPGLKTAVHVYGTLNDPKDEDQGWSVEFALPWAVLKEFAHKPAPPRDGDQWRVNFSRVEYLPEIILTTNVRKTEKSFLTKADGTRCENWIWSPQGIINMHCPEKWGYVQFSTGIPGTVEFRPDPTEPARMILHEIYYAQRDFFRKNNRWATTIDDLGLAVPTHKSVVKAPVIKRSGDGYTATLTVKLPDGSQKTVSIDQFSKVTVE
ncbi:carbohydrate-binding family 9-like protein [bacterium]|nr:carbohydrate-binding family 9-like protein [bacterium]